MLHGGGGAKASDRGPKQRDSHSEGPAVPYVDVPKPTPTPIPASGPPASTLTEATASVKHSPDGQRCRKGIFAGLTVYINGSTAPLVSDHRLKQLLAEEGARLSLHLGRRAVTHVILGKPNHRVGGSGSDKMVAKDGEGRDRGWCGGGLAGGKLDREIRRIRGEGVRFVGVEWYAIRYALLQGFWDSRLRWLCEMLTHLPCLCDRVLESIRAGKRLPEARFATLKMSAAGQGSVYHEFAAAGRTKANSASACTVVNEGTDAVPPSGQSAVE